MSELTLVPIDSCVLVEIEKIKGTSEKGIYLNPDYVEKQQMTIVEGTLVALGDLAFYDLISNDKKYPKTNNKVYFKRHSGILHEINKDDEKENRIFRIIEDKDIYAFEE